jgi:hypothetical protein
MKKLIQTLLLFCSTGIVALSQPPMGPPPANQPADILISTGTLHTDLIYKVSGRDGRLYQAYLGEKLSSPSNISQMRNGVHLAYATFGTDNLFEPGIKICQSYHRKT